jgi:hypothetical protein
VQRYEVVHAGTKPDPRTLADESEPIAAPAPVAPGQSQTIPLPDDLNAFVAVRAVDDQGNVGPLTVVRTGRPARVVPPRLTLSLSPKRARAGQATTFRFKVTAVVRGRKRVVKKAKVRFGGRTLRTDGDGRAQATLSLARGTHTAKATRKGFRSGSAAVRIRR